MHATAEVQGILNVTSLFPTLASESSVINTRLTYPLMFAIAASVFALPNIGNAQSFDDRWSIISKANAQL
jgi:hypothetical protein